MKIAFLCEGVSIPASRFRVQQFIPYFEKKGITCDVTYGYGSDYAEKSARFGGAYKLFMRIERLRSSTQVDEFDLVFIQRPTFPQSAIGEELVNWLNPNTIFDFDDSLWMGPDGVESFVRRRGFDRTVDICAHLIAGNEFLSTEAGHPEKTTVIPTVIDAVRYVPAVKAESAMIIGWMGTAGNFPFLERTVPSLKAALQRYPNARFRLVSNADFKPLLGHPQVEQIRWSADTEISLLQSFDIGLMPLVDSPLTRGKCAFKMIQYMAVGRPVIVSAVGANVDVFGDVTNPPGRMLSSFDWEDVLSELIEDGGLRRSMGERGRERVEQHYSIEAVLPQYFQIFESLVRQQP